MMKKMIYIIVFVLIIASGVYGIMWLLDSYDSDNYKEVTKDIGTQEVSEDIENKKTSDSLGSSLGDLSATRNFKFDLPLFDKDSAWNQKVIGLAVENSSDAQMLQTYRIMRKLYKEWMYIDAVFHDFSVAIGQAGDVMHNIDVCNYDGQLDWSNPKVMPSRERGGPVSIPNVVGVARPAGPSGDYSDGHLVLYNPSTNIAHEFWQASTKRRGKCKSAGGGIAGNEIVEAGTTDYFDVSGSGTNYPNPYFSARASGVSLLAGLILPEDIASGEIRHGLAFAIDGPRNINNKDDFTDGDVVYPASVTETEHYSTHPDTLIMGQRLRLKDKIVDDNGNVIDESEFNPITRMLIKAMREYGIYLVDNGGGFSIYAEDYHTANLNLSLDEVNRLVGNSANTPLPEGKTQWQVIMTGLEDLEVMPIAYGAWEYSDNWKKAEIITSNFEVIKPASPPQY